MDNSLFGISYDTWSEICRMYLYLSSKVSKRFFQLFPFSKLSSKEKKYILSEDFFNLYIKNGAFLFKEENKIITDNFILKSDNTFRHATIISPLLYLVQQAIGKEIWRFYKSERPEQIQVFYAGDYEKSVPTYKKQYDSFCKTLNINKRNFDFFIKTDISDFFSNINLDKLISFVDENCNSEENIFSQYILQVYKEFIIYCGKGRFACTENSVAASFLSTVVYLDKIDTELYNYLNSNDLITSFMMIRYVDDLYIFCSFKKEYTNINSIFRNIFEEYSTILRRYDLSINSKKSVIRKVNFIDDELSKSLYDERVKNIPFKVLEVFAKNVSLFLQELIGLNTSNELSFDSYNQSIEKFLNIQDFEYSSLEILNQFSYDNKLIKRFPELKQKLNLLFSGDLSFLSYDPKRLIALLLKTEDERIIKRVLNILFKKAHLKRWSAFDSAIAINYLLGRNFVHHDLINILQNANFELCSYVNKCCVQSFIVASYSNVIDKICSLVSLDWKTCFLYFMYCMEISKNNYLSAYAYFKNFFDRFTAILAFEINYAESRKKGKPNYAKFFKESEHTKFYASIKNSKEIISNAHKLRNHNPINHASAELIDVKVFSDEIKQMIEDLKKLITDFMKFKEIY